ncbi:hypothetical protein RD110_07945 [Rhodoferax koreense]|uniref:DUF1828 domain-containing protein n=1 Tax=Rhodoferax koreensis TaxID=1842727 RepID=A0A1P8JTT1_9BURK|nr:DUF1828 domain-containing protein [Rhodoferax koreense]APW37135.1 hypothetical protein RD110_07945 [Rhodoferax koreense]
MLNCSWASALTRFDCQTIRALDGSPCLEIGTPFSLPDGSAINLYIHQVGQEMLKISDNADTLFQLGGMGLDVWQAARLNAVRDLMKRHKMAVGERGEVFLLAKHSHAASGFALAITGLLALSGWAANHMEIDAPEIDIVAQMEPYIIARDPNAVLKRRPHARGASSTDYTFDLQHGRDLIDVIPADPRSTGAAMRKAGDIQNGPFAEHLSPLIIVYDLVNSEKATNEISILGSMTRAMPASHLMATFH